MSLLPRTADRSARKVVRRRTVVGLTAAAGTALLSASLGTRPGSRAFYLSTAAVAATWTAGGLLAGPPPSGRQEHPVAEPAVFGVGLFSAFYGAALVAREIPPLERALSNVLTFAEEGQGAAVLLTTLANGVGEEVFFRGALYTALGDHHPAAVSTGLYVASTATTRNPALALAAVVMGTVFAWQRRRTEGIVAPLVTHLTWSALMVRFLPPLFRSRQQHRA